jgi:hypothetical protein
VIEMLKKPKQIKIKSNRSAYDLNKFGLSKFYKSTSAYDLNDKGLSKIHLLTRW